jgi:hypothetical protein
MKYNPKRKNVLMFSLTHNLQFWSARALLIVAFFVFSAGYTHAADILMAPATGNYSVGQTFTVAVRVSPAGSSINAVEAGLKFNPAVLSVVSVSKEGSVFSLWTTEPAFSNTAGTITFGGGSPAPFTAQSNLLNVTFRTLAAGSGSLSVANASVLAADGRGTDVFKNGSTGAYAVAAGVTPALSW